VLAVANINKSFYHNPVLNNLSFRVNDGDVIALTGKNGAGKSTLLRILARISQPDGGTVIYNDVDIFKAQASARRGILYLGHEPGLYPSLSAIENIEFASRIHGALPVAEDITTTLKNIGLSEQINDPIKIYSKGMLQKNFTFLFLLFFSTSKTCGITSPALCITTTSPILMSFLKISSSLCNVALETTTPPTLTGLIFATGVRAPVLPT